MGTRSGGGAGWGRGVGVAWVRSGGGGGAKVVGRRGQWFRGFGHSPLGWFGEDATAHYMRCLCSVDEQCTIRQLAIYKDTVDAM